MGGIELQTAYALVVTLSLLLSLDFIVQWYYRHERSLHYLCTRVLRPISYITFTSVLLAFIEKDRTRPRRTTYRVLLGCLILGSLWVCLGLQVRHQKPLLLRGSLLTLGQALIMWRLCSNLKDGGHGRAYTVTPFGSLWKTFSRQQLLLIADLSIVIALHGIAFGMPHRHNDCNIRAIILALSNVLVYLLALIPAYYVRTSQRHHQRKLRGVDITIGISCLASVASLGLLGLLANSCDWRNIILVSRGLSRKPLSDVNSSILS